MSVQFLPRQAHVLIVLLGSIGDVIRALPLVNAMKQVRSDLKISWAVETKSLPILEAHTGIDHIFHFPRERGWREFGHFMKDLRNARFDCVFDLQRHFKSGVISYLTRTPRRIGFHRRNCKEFNWVWSTETIPFFNETEFKLLHYLQFLECIGVPIPAQLDFGLVSKHPFPGLPARFIALVLGSSWESKDWFLSGYQGLCNRILAGSSHDMVLLGDRSRAADAEKLVSTLDSSRVLNLAGKTSLRDLIPILSQADVAAGPDSGPGHLCSAFGVPYVTLFGPTLSSRVVPYGSEQFAVQAKLGCAPCMRRTCPGLGRLCMRLITPDQVWAKLRGALPV